MPLIDVNPNNVNNLQNNIPSKVVNNPASIVNTSPAVPMPQAVGPMPELKKATEEEVAKPSLQNATTAQLTIKKYALEQILGEAIRQTASDVHLSVGYRAIIRVDGNLITLNTNVLEEADIENYLAEIVKSRGDIKPKDDFEIDLSYAFKDRRFRVNIFRESGRHAVVMRLVPKDILTMDELGLPQIFKQFAKLPAGLILVTGPTGSGKSTSLASILNHINITRSENIITLEDPIEFVYEKKNSLIQQREYGIDFENWPDALKSLLREDPNVVLVGEMRDYETIASAITVSETGHLVFATLHTNSASQSIDRIIDVFPDAQQAQIRSQLANVITAIVSQRLVKIKSGGRKSVMELMVANSAVRNAIRESKTYQIDNMIQTGQDFGMISMEKSLVDLVRKNEISVETAMQTTIKPKELELLLNKS